MALVRLLVLKMLELNIRFHVKHIPGLQNVLSDKMSRFQVSKELLQSFKMSTVPTDIPQEIMPHNLDLS